MKRIHVLFVVLISFCDVKAQEWFPVGASWYYNQVILFEGEGYAYFEVEEELVINGRICKIISGHCFCTISGLEGYFYQEGDKIYLYNPDVEDSLKLLYDFTRVPGDTLTITSDELVADGEFLIDSITTIQFGSETLRVQHISALNDHAGWGSIIIEKIGANGCLYPQVTFCDPATGGLRCYEDPLVGLINFQDPIQACNYITTSVAEPTESMDLTIYPNPASNLLQIRSDRNIERLRFFNSLGTPHSQISVSFNHGIVLDLYDIPDGFYVMLIGLDNGQTVYRSVVIQK